jgi:trimethylamine:corrinoid methyltransferase-like protein
LRKTSARKGISARGRIVVLEKDEIERIDATSKRILSELGISVYSGKVSKAMGHASVETTQRYYVRIKTNRAFDEIDRAYASASIDSIPVDCETARWCK